MASEDAAMSTPRSAPAPRIRTFRAAAGLSWVRQGLRLFARQPLVLAVLVGLGPLLLLTLKVVPLLGDLASLLLTPAIGVGMLTVCRSIRAGEPAGISSYLAALREPVRRLRLLQLGAYYAIFAGLVSLALSFVPAPPAAGGADLHARPSGGATSVSPSGPAADSSTPIGAATNPSAPSSPATDDASAPALPPAPAAPAAAASKAMPAAPDFTANPIPLPVFFALALVAVPFLMTIWFAPVLCGWYGMSAPKALFFSFFACWRNRTAMLVYLITLLGIWVLAVLVLASLIDVLNAKEGLAPYLLLAPLVFIIVAIAQSANLAMVEDVIDDGRDSSPLPSGEG